MQVSEKVLAGGIVLSAFLALWVFEHRFPLRTQNRPLGRRLIVNGVMSSLTYLTAFLTVAPLVKWAFDLKWNYGILSLLPEGSFWLFPAGILLFDLSFYYWHRLNHIWPWLWRFHNVHHIDPNMDVTTGFRFHFGEVAASSLFRAAQILVIGGPWLLYVVYETAFQVCVFFHHSNLRLPLPVEKFLSLGMVTPRIHNRHHIHFEADTHSNYGVIFSFWDRLHRTYRGLNTQPQLPLGIPAYSQTEDNDILRLLRFPFQKQRSYWKPFSPQD